MPIKEKLYEVEHKDREMMPFNPDIPPYIHQNKKWRRVAGDRQRQKRSSTNQADTRVFIEKLPMISKAAIFPIQLRFKVKSCEAYQN